MIAKRTFLAILNILAVYILFYFIFRYLGRSQYAFSYGNFPYIFLGIQVIASYMGTLILFKYMKSKIMILRIIGYIIVGYIIGLLVLTLNFFWIEFFYNPYVLYQDDLAYQVYFKYFNENHIDITKKYLRRLYLEDLSINYGFWLMAFVSGIFIELQSKK